MLIFISQHLLDWEAVKISLLLTEGQGRKHSCYQWISFTSTKTSCPGRLEVGAISCSVHVFIIHVGHHAVLLASLTFRWRKSSCIPIKFALLESIQDFFFFFLQIHIIPKVIIFFRNMESTFSQCFHPASGVTAICITGITGHNNVCCFKGRHPGILYCWIDSRCFRCTFEDIFPYISVELCCLFVMMHNVWSRMDKKTNRFSDAWVLISYYMFFNTLHYRCQNSSTICLSTLGILVCFVNECEKDQVYRITGNQPHTFSSSIQHYHLLSIKCFTQNSCATFKPMGSFLYSTSYIKKLFWFISPWESSVQRWLV